MTDRTEIKYYIENYFHPYFDIGLKPDSISTTNFVNCIIPLELNQELDDQKQPWVDFTHNKQIDERTSDEILSEYDDTNIEKEYKVFCRRVIDGDTLEVEVLEKLTDKIIYNSPQTMRVRLVGVNTPESNKMGYETSKDFVQKLCEKKTIYLNVDNNNPVDKYGRTLAVVIVENKNLNEILLKEKVAEIMFIPPSEFYPFDWDETAYVSNMNIQNIDFGPVITYLNNDITNIAFTNQDDNNIIHQFEVYKDMIYLRLYPYNSRIRLHILPKSYDGSSNLLIFKDEFVTEDNIQKTVCFSNFMPPINVETAQSNAAYEMTYDISESTKGFTTLQINAGYKYPSLNKVFHLTGVKDETNEVFADRCTLIDANYDNQNGATTSNNISQLMLSENNIIYPTSSNLNIQKYSNEMNVNHCATTKTFHKIIKYMNDDLYIEEERQHLKHNWGE